MTGLLAGGWFETSVARAATEGHSRLDPESRARLTLLLIGILLLGGILLLTVRWFSSYIRRSSGGAPKRSRLGPWHWSVRPGAGPTTPRRFGRRVGTSGVGTSRMMTDERFRAERRVRLERRVSPRLRARPLGLGRLPGAVWLPQFAAAVSLGSVGVAPCRLGRGAQPLEAAVARSVSARSGAVAAGLWI